MEEVEERTKGGIEMKCRVCGGEYEVETCCTSSVTCYDKEAEAWDEGWISMQGFIERRKCCKEALGDGYGDVNHYKTEEEADKETDGWKRKIGEWF